MKKILNNHHTSNAKPITVAGFSTILVLMVLLIGFWSKNLSDNKHLLLSMANKTVEAGLVTHLFNAIHKQTMLLHKMEDSISISEKEIWYEKYLYENSVLLDSYSRITVIDFTSKNVKSWDSIKKQFANRNIINNTSANFYAAGNNKKTFSYLIKKISPIHDNLMSELSDILNNNILSGTEKSVDGIINEAIHKISTTYFLVYLLGGISLSLGIFTVYIIRRTENTEDALVGQSERIQWLYEATSISGISLDERITETLKLGCRVLNMEIGKLGRQFPEKNESIFLNTIAPSDLPAKRGLILPLDKTFCNITFSTDGPIAIHHVSESSYQSHPAAEFLGMEAYIGTTIYVHDQKFGTVNFSNRQPMEKPFTKTDVDFVNLLGKWISVTMEQIIIEEKLQQSKNNAEAASQAKTDFLANMSHEIRTPLTAILGYSEMLLDEDQTQEEMEHEINSIITSGSHLQQIINDILDLSKIEAGQLIVEHKNVSPIIFMNDLDAILGPQAREKKLLFTLDYQFPIPELINTDSTRLKQILLNLCGNAIKFTHEGSVTISLRYLSETNQLSITIDDTGIGISEHAQKKIFNPFTQADESTTRIYGGTGLGLCISKQLAKMLGGDITLTSTTNVGSTFTTIIDVNIEKNKIVMLTEVPIKNTNLANTPTYANLYLQGHILLIEDNIENQKLIEKSIRKIGVTVDIAENGKTGVEKALSGDYSLILMDLQMPVMGGLNAIQILRESEYTTPIIGLTANAMQEDKNNCLKAGANGYLSKPLDFNLFYKVLSDFLPEAGQQNTHSKKRA